MRLGETYLEVDELMGPLNEHIKAYMAYPKTNPRVKSEVESELDCVSHLIGEVGSVMFRLRFLSWEVLREHQKAGEIQALSYSISTLRVEIKDHGYALQNAAISLQERARALRSFLTY